MRAKEGIMQFHLNGFEPGDPEIFDRSERYPASGAQGSVPEKVDVLIIGCGPAGLTLAAQLSAFPDIKSCIVEQKSGRMLLGQADGIACRTMEMFHAFGFSERVLKEASWINETTFWKPDDRQPEKIVRSARVQDVEDGLSEFPHVVLNQARVHDFYLDLMRRSATKLEPHYARRVIAIQPAAGGSDQMSVTLERLDSPHQGLTETVTARYVVGCDGARSIVRTSIGRELRGDSANHAWGVMDVLAVTDFPDIRCKSVIQSANDNACAGRPSKLTRRSGRLGTYPLASNVSWTSPRPPQTSQRHWPVPLHSLQSPLGMPAINVSPLPRQAGQELVLWP
jgi:phenol 2-monooxygenase